MSPTIPTSLLVLTLSSAAVPPVISDADARVELLALANAIASAIPENPHAKDRARMQEVVVDGCIDVGMLDAASTYATTIRDWRRGEALARIAQCWGRRGDTAGARALVDKALLVAAGESDWRRERITIEAVKAAVLLGNETEVATLTSRMSAPARGVVEAARTPTIVVEQLDRQADEFDRAIATNNFDLVRGAIDGYLALLARSEHDEARSARAVKGIEAAIPGLPRDLQVTTTIELAMSLHRQGKADPALARLDGAAALFAGTAFLPEDTAPLGASVATARAAIQGRELASADLQRLLVQLESDQAKIVDVRRARSWRSLAEAFADIGDPEHAMACFSAAIEAGALNPNARPRAEDLCATCVSMARAGIVPTPAQRQRIDAIRLALVDPW